MCSGCANHRDQRHGLQYLRVVDTATAERVTVKPRVGDATSPTRTATSTQSATASGTRRERHFRTWTTACHAARPDIGTSAGGALPRAWARARRRPELVGRPEQLVELDVTLRELAADGDIALPAPRSWDRTTTPALPRFVTIPAAWPTTARTVLADPPVVPGARMVRVRAHHDRCAVRVARRDSLTPRRRRCSRSRSFPCGLRSAEIFGDEKALERLATTGLFGHGRLTFELLGARRSPPPLHIVEAGSGPDLLVLENADPFWVCCDVTASPGRIGRVAFGGAGQAFLASAAAIAWNSGCPNGSSTGVTSTRRESQSRPRPHACSPRSASPSNPPYPSASDAPQGASIDGIDRVA